MVVRGLGSILKKIIAALNKKYFMSKLLSHFAALVLFLLFMLARHENFERKKIRRFREMFAPLF
jgi:predicted PurR-regulated permease PerM